MTTGSNLSAVGFRRLEHDVRDDHGQRVLQSVRRLVRLRHAGLLHPAERNDLPAFARRHSRLRPALASINSTTLFTATDCVLHCTKIGHMVRDNRKLFLTKKAWHTFKGYAYSQLNEMDSKKPEPGSKRALIREKFGFDVKFAYNVVRLMDEVEQILVEGDIDLRRNREQLKAIRRGDIPQADIRRMFTEKERDLERLYHSSSLPYGPDEPKIKQLLIDCLEEHYGDLSSCVLNPDALTIAFRCISAVVHKYEKLIA